MGLFLNTFLAVICRLAEVFFHFFCKISIQVVLIYGTPCTIQHAICPDNVLYIFEFLSYFFSLRPHAWYYLSCVVHSLCLSFSFSHYFSFSADLHVRTTHSGGACCSLTAELRNKTIIII